jgi:L-ribulose-5-phosphate 3-epimerase
MASKSGVILAFETMETDFLNTCAKGMKYVSLIDSPYLQMYPDTGNITNAARSADSAAAAADEKDDLKSAKGHIAALHLKESKPGVFREVSFGDGWVDFPALISLALSLGVRMFTTEFWHLKGEDYPAVIAKSKAYIDSCFNL